MKRKITPKSQISKTSGVRREREPVSWRYVILSAVCGLILAVGFFGAARQHFASINYGIQNAKLRKQADELRSEQRRLLLAREVSLSPGEIKKNARKIGFTEMTASNIQTFRNDTESSEKPNANKSDEPEDKSKKIEPAAGKKDPDKKETVNRSKESGNAAGRDAVREKVVKKKVEEKEEKSAADQATTRKRKM